MGTSKSIVIWRELTQTGREQRGPQRQSATWGLGSMCRSTQVTLGTGPILVQTTWR